ncbi:hypothetical protein UFOVP1229_146 [uncultured Caudovirales phage]|uniref:Uncharacterized protein n=1 Tax=uncultured Caudovirales phage TaxID=2100421 RepID=A0A6J5R3B8_9CAUD|nr:hypothetical protein UFOVP1229_146 [uncultured Caudovirales phage]
MKPEIDIPIVMLECDHCETSWKTALAEFPNLGERFEKAKIGYDNMIMSNDPELVAFERRRDELKQLKPCWDFVSPDGFSTSICADCLREIANKCDSFQGKP